MSRKLVHDKAEVVDVVDEDDDTMTVRLAAAKEIVQNYGNYNAYKSAEALSKASFTAKGAYITFTHPSDHGVVTNQEEIIGFAGSPEFEENESTLYVEADIDKDRTKPNVIEGINDGSITDVSIGFYTDEIPEEGMYNGKSYDVRQSNIVIDHVAILPQDSEGRCSSENGCGIVENIDQAAGDNLVLADDRAVADIAAEDKQDLADAHAALKLLGFDVEARACNCGDHHGHLTVEGLDEEKSDGLTFEWDAVREEFDGDGGFEDENLQDFIRQASEHSNRPMSDQNIEDYDIEELEDNHAEVKKLSDKAQEAQERVDELEDKLEDMREDQAQELRDELVDEFGVAEDKVEEKNLDALEDLKDTLEASDLSKSDEDEEEEDGDEPAGDVANTKPSGAKSNDDSSKPLTPGDSKKRVTRE